MHAFALDDVAIEDTITFALIDNAQSQASVIQSRSTGLSQSVEQAIEAY